MTPKQMIEGQIAEFRILAENAMASAAARKSFAMNDSNLRRAQTEYCTADAEAIRAATLDWAAERLAGLLNLKGWE